MKVVVENRMINGREIVVTRVRGAVPDQPERYVRPEVRRLRELVLYEDEEGQFFVPLGVVLQSNAKLRFTPDQQDWWVPDEVVEQLKWEEAEEHNRNIMLHRDDEEGSCEAALREEVWNGFVVLDKLNGAFRDWDDRDVDESTKSYRTAVGVFCETFKEWRPNTDMGEFMEVSPPRKWSAFWRPDLVHQIEVGEPDDRPWMPRMTPLEHMHWRLTQDRNREKEESEGDELQGHIDFLTAVHAFGMEGFFQDIDEVPDQMRDLLYFDESEDELARLYDELEEASDVPVEDLPSPTSVVVAERLPHLLWMRREFHRVSGGTDFGFLNWVRKTYPKFAHVHVSGRWKGQRIKCQSRPVFPTQSVRSVSECPSWVEIKRACLSEAERLEIEVTSLEVEMSRTRKSAPRDPNKPQIDILKARQFDPVKGWTTRWYQRWDMARNLWRGREGEEKRMANWCYDKLQEVMSEYLRRLAWSGTITRETRAIGVGVDKDGKTYYHANSMGLQVLPVRSVLQWDDQEVSFQINTRLSREAKRLFRMTSRMNEADAKFIRGLEEWDFEVVTPVIRVPCREVLPYVSVLEEIRGYEHKEGESHPWLVERPQGGFVLDESFTKTRWRTHVGEKPRVWWNSPEYCCKWCVKKGLDPLPYVLDNVPWHYFQTEDNVKSAGNLRGVSGAWRCARCGTIAKSDSVRLEFQIKISGKPKAAIYTVTADVFGDVFLRSLWAARPHLRLRLQDADRVVSIMNKIK